jgi:chloride channel protein, CIC family
LTQRSKTFTLPALAPYLERGSVVFYSLVLGTTIGVLGWGFGLVLGIGQQFLLGLGNRPPNPPLSGGLPFVLEGPFELAPLLLIPLALLVLHFWAKAAGQSDPLEAAVSLHHRGTPLEGARVHFSKALSNVLGLSVGLGVGRDGGLAALGSLAVAWLARAADLSALELRSLRLAGIAAGLGIALQSPVAAALFVLEMGFSSLELASKAMLASLLCALSGYAVYSLLAGSESLFTFSLAGSNTLISPSFLVFAVLLGLVCAGLGLLFAEGIAWAQKGAALLYQGKFALPIRLLGGLTLGGIAVFLPSSAGEGLGWFSLQLTGFFDVTTLSQLVLFKSISLLLLVALGYSSGLLIPTLVLGGSLGGLLGLLVGLILPASAPSLPEASLLGACAFMAASYKTPLSSLLLGLGWATPALLPALGVAVGSAYMFSGNASMLPSQDKTAHDLTETDPLEPAHLEPAHLEPAHLEPAQLRQLLEQHLLQTQTPSSQTPSSETESEVPELLHRIPVLAQWVGTSAQMIVQGSRVVFIALLRAGEIQIGSETTPLELGDQLVLIASDSDFSDFEEIQKARAAQVESPSV